MSKTENPTNVQENTDMQLTAKDFKKEGVEVKLTQNDILEIIADAKYKEIMEDISKNSFDNIHMLYREIYIEEMKQAEAYKAEILGRVSDLHPDIPVQDFTISANIHRKTLNSSVYESEVLRHLRTREKAGEIQVEPSASFKVDIYKNNEFVIECNVSTRKIEKFDDGELRMDIEYKFSKPLVVIDEGAKKVKVSKIHDLYNSFVKKYSNFFIDYQYVFNLSKITRDARVNLNKSILNAQAPDIKKALKRNFKIDLNAK